ncbi:MAG: hypothetical protein KAX49_14215 [Halanaerobiales bacterium]|nr:hypothetical protein [Halanaerobiales bacterium]
MVKKYTVFLICFLVLFSVIGCTDIIKNNDADLSEILFFDIGKKIIGIDSDSYEIKLDFEFDTYVVYGDIADDERIFVVDDGKRVGVWGKQFFVLDKKGEIEEKIKIFPNSRVFKIIGDKIFISNSAYTEDGYTGLQILDLNTYELLYQSKKIGEIINKKNIQRHNSSVIIGVPPFVPLNRKSYIMKFDLETLQRESIYKFTERHPFERYDILSYKDYLVVTFNNSREVLVFDLKNNQVVKTILIDELIDIPDRNDDSLILNFSDPMIIEQNLVFFLRDNTPNVDYQKLLIFDKDSFEFKKEITLNCKYDLRFYTIKYIRDNKIFFQNGRNICVYDYRSGKFLKDFIFHN